MGDGKGSERREERSPLSPLSPKHIITHTHSCKHRTLSGTLANIHAFNLHDLQTPTHTTYGHRLYFQIEGYLAFKQPLKLRVKK